MLQLSLLEHNSHAIKGMCKVWKGFLLSFYLNAFKIHPIFSVLYIWLNFKFIQIQVHPNSKTNQYLKRIFSSFCLNLKYELKFLIDLQEFIAHRISDMKIVLLNQLSDIRCPIDQTRKIGNFLKCAQTQIFNEQQNCLDPPFIFFIFSLTWVKISFGSLLRYLVGLKILGEVYLG